MNTDVLDYFENWVMSELPHDSVRLEDAVNGQYELLIAVGDIVVKPNTQNSVITGTVMEINTDSLPCIDIYFENKEGFNDVLNLDIVDLHYKQGNCKDLRFYRGGR